MALKNHWSGLSADWITNKWHLSKKKTSKHQKICYMSWHKSIKITKVTLFLSFLSVLTGTTNRKWSFFWVWWILQSNGNRKLRGPFKGLPCKGKVNFTIVNHIKRMLYDKLVLKSLQQKNHSVKWLYIENVIFKSNIPKEKNAFSDLGELNEVTLCSSSPLMLMLQQMAQLPSHSNKLTRYPTVRVRHFMQIWSCLTSFSSMIH